MAKKKKVKKSTDEKILKELKKLRKEVKDIKILLATKEIPPYKEEEGAHVDIGYDTDEEARYVYEAIENIREALDDYYDIFNKRS